MKKEISVSVESSGHDVMVGLAKIAKACKEALADGFQPGSDLPVIVMEAVKELPAVIAALPAIAPDLAEDKMAFIKGVNLGAYEVVDALGVK